MSNLTWPEPPDGTTVAIDYSDEDRTYRTCIEEGPGYPMWFDNFGNADYWADLMPGAKAVYVVHLEELSVHG